MKKTSVLVVALVLSLIGNIWMGVQLNAVNNRAVTAMASVAAVEQTASNQGEQLSELTQKLADAEAKTQAVQAELDNLTALQAEQKAKVGAEQVQEQQAAAKEKVKQQQEAAKKAEEEKLQNPTDPDASTPDKPTGGGSQGGGIKEPAGGIGSTPAGKMVGSSITEVGEWNSKYGGWEAVDSSGDRGILFPGGGFETGLE